jgi:hypothetical protein
VPPPLPPLRLDQLVLNQGIGKQGRQSVNYIWLDLPATGRSKVEFQLAGWLIVHCGWLVHMHISLGRREAATRSISGKVEEPGKGLGEQKTPIEG